MRIWGFDILEQGSKATVQDAFDLAQELKDEWERGYGWREPRVANPTLIPHRWGHLDVLLKRKWFERLWVIQELAMAQRATVMCGQCEIAWEAIRGAADTLMSYVLSPEHGPIGNLPFLYTLGISSVTDVSLSNTSDRSNFLSVLYGVKDAIATDARDRLYAVKSLMDVEETDIDIDYSRRVEVVYREWAKKRIQRTKSLEVFSVCTNSTPTISE
jgi:hypothetical protein